MAPEKKRSEEEMLAALRRLLILGRPALVYSGVESRKTLEHETAEFVKELTSNEVDVAKIYATVASVRNSHPNPTRHAYATFFAFYANFLSAKSVDKQQDAKTVSVYSEAKKYLDGFEDLVIFCGLRRTVKDSLTKKQENEKRKGFGRGVRKMVQNFYVPEKDLREKAVKLAETRTFDGWSHLDLLRISHLLGFPMQKTTSLKSGFFIELVKNFRAANFAEFLAKYANSDDVELQQVAALVDSVHTLRAKDAAPPAVAKIIDEFPFQVSLKLLANNSHLASEKDVALALIRKLKMDDLLFFIGTLTVHGLLTDDASPHLSSLVKRIAAAKDTAADVVSPAKLLWFWEFYEKNRGAIKRKNETLKKQKKEAKYFAPKKILDALSDAFLLSFKHVAGSLGGKNVMICVDVRPSMCDHAVNGYKPLRPIDVAALLLMQALRSESGSTTCLGFGLTGLVQIDVNAKHTFEEVEKRLTETKCGSFSTKLPFEFASDKKQKVDAFILLTTSPPKPKQVADEWRRDAVDGLTKYNGAMATSSKAVLCYFKMEHVKEVERSTDYVLTVGGWNHFVPDVVFGFVKGEF